MLRKWAETWTLGPEKFMKICGNPKIGGRIRLFNPTHKNYNKIHTKNILYINLICIKLILKKLPSSERYISAKVRFFIQPIIRNPSTSQYQDIHRSPWMLHTRLISSRRWKLSHWVPPGEYKQDSSNIRSSKPMKKQSTHKLISP